VGVNNPNFAKAIARHRFYLVCETDLVALRF